jgi:glycosyltransferase involved in cell wall biosynthesis/3-hydroxymyristoyl/3-hydroxydecanoyl-(acyl carrier protein) dehydratase
MKELYAITAAPGEGVFEVELDPGHEVFAGHFPGNPVLPGVCSLSIVRECASRVAGESLCYVAVRESKFLGVISPSMKLRVEVSLAENEEGGLALTASISNEEQVMVKVRATLARPKEYVAVIPVYNNVATVADVVERTRRHVKDVIVVDDGSTDGTTRVLATLNDIEVTGYRDNRGKGHALRTGLAAAMERGFRYAITIDADGQHFPEDIPLFIAQAAETPGALVIGARNLAQDNMPGRNTFANRFSNFWFRLETGRRMDDTQSGFRLWPLDALRGMRWVTGRYEFELESAVRLSWRGVKVVNIPVRVFYAPEGERVSHFKPGRDFARISLLNSVLVLVALLWVYPVKFVRWLSWRNVREFVRTNITHSGESNTRLAAAIGLGVFWGIAPVWGYQMILAGVTAHLLKLNKIVAVASSNISIPPMIPLILFGSLAVGAVIMGRPVMVPIGEISPESVAASLVQYLVGSVTLALAAGTAMWGVSWVMLKLLRKEPRNG